MRKALLRIHQGQRGPAGVRLLVPQLHNDQLPTGRHRGNRTNRFSKSSFIVSLFSKDFCLFARIYNIKTNVSEMLICCFEREAAPPELNQCFGNKPLAFQMLHSAQ